MNRKQQALMADPEVRRTLEEELLFGEATDTIAALLESLGITQKELAKRLDVSEGRVSQILSGAENLTLRSLGALGWALGLRFQLQAIPVEDRAGTPSGNDPPAPAWLARVRELHWSFQHMQMPPAEPRTLSPRPYYGPAEGDGLAA